jgi:hypothetical protein
MVRMVLHDARNWDEYEKLNQAMEERGFARTLAGNKGTYHLPPAEFWFKGDQTLADVRMLAASAAETTGQPFGMVVVKADGWSVMRLKTVDTPHSGDGDTKLKPRGRRG